MLTLSPADQTHLAQVHRVLFSPLGYSDLDDWRRQVCRGVKELLGADTAAFALPIPGVEAYYSEDLSPHVISKYSVRAEPLEHQWSAFRRGCELGVYSREQLFQSDLDAYYRSAYYNEYIVPAALFDLIGMNSLLGGHPGPRTVAHLLLYHERPTGRKFGERGFQLLRLLHPAFEAGVRTLRQFGAQRRALAVMLDQLPHGVLACDRAGRAIHENVALGEMLAREPDAIQVRNAMQAIARTIVGTLLGAVPESGRLTQELRTAKARYRLGGSLVDERVLGAGALVLVTLERTTPELPSTERLRAWYGLTKREAEVARLIGEGKSNEEIAKALFVSPHTARHHTERVMQKLVVKSRAEVAGKVLLG